MAEDYELQYLENGQVVWGRGRENGAPIGLTSTQYVHDGTLVKIRAALLDSLEQIEGQLSLNSGHVD